MFFFSFLFVKINFKNQKLPTNNEFSKISLLSETHRTPICLIGDPSDTSTCFIGDPSDTDMPQYIIPIYINKKKVYKNKIIFKCVEISIRLRRHFGLRWGMSVSDGSPMRRVGLQWGRSVSDELFRGLRWVSDQACLSPIYLRWVSDRSPLIIIFS